MKLHEIKLLKEYALPKSKGLKPFEIRFNDRNYEVGDLVRYIVDNDIELNRYFSCRLYQIVYITSYAQNIDFVVFADSCIIENLGV